MKREWPLIAVSVLALLSGTAATAQTRSPQAARETAQSHALPGARVVRYHAAPTRGAASRGVTTGSTATAAPSTLIARVAPQSLPHDNPSVASLHNVATRLRPNAMAVPSGRSVQRHSPVNAALGGPSTNDARRLVRR